MFEKNYERKLVKNKKQLINLILYIHNNPVKHGFVEDNVEYPWTSYTSLVSEELTILKRKQVVEYFEDLENFKYLHKQLGNKQDSDL
ncbi:MAG: hypothetical protein KAR57_07615 [Bacteroidales bacterium]|nr:hypothetical protein [Bacteroidales bacterium]